MSRELLIRRMSRPFNMMSRMLDDFEHDYKRALQPEDGHYVTWEMKPIHWQIETNDNGDVIHRRLNEEEVDSMQSHEKEGNS